MKKTTTLLLIGLMLSSFFFMSSKLSIAQDDEEEVWDFTGVVRQTSDDYRGVIHLPTDPEVGNYTKPTVYMNVLGYDTNKDVLMDTYYGFWGVGTFDLDHYNLSVKADVFTLKLNVKWSLRIPEGSPLHWEVLYYPSPLYEEIRKNLVHNIPIYYVNLTKAIGCNLQYRMDLGLNYTLGNFTTYGAGNPLVPELPTFPEYNLSVPLFTANLPIPELEVASFFDSPAGLISVLVIISLLSYHRRKKRKKMNQS
ncbi:MAG: hypothetical protein ACTSQF_10205 [Candidatus Heimdallarchaeaceae archaeon]